MFSTVSLIYATTKNNDFSLSNKHSAAFVASYFFTRLNCLQLFSGLKHFDYVVLYEIY